MTKFENGMEYNFEGWTKILSRWTKNGNDRVYINNDNRKSCGYIDLKTREIHWSAEAYAHMPNADAFVASILAMEF